MKGHGKQAEERASYINVDSAAMAGKGRLIRKRFKYHVFKTHFPRENNATLGNSTTVELF